MAKPSVGVKLGMCGINLAKAPMAINTKIAIILSLFFIDLDFTAKIGL